MSRLTKRGLRSQRTGLTRLLLLRVLAVLSLTAGTLYVTWRWVWSVNWDNWWIAVPLIVAETYALIDGFLFAVTIWRLRQRGPAPEPPADATVDVLITTYNEPVDMVMATARAAQQISWPHQTYVLDDGNRPEMRAAAEALGVGYINRGEEWEGKPRHAKAGNLNNALFETFGEFMLILDADQIPHPEIVSHTLGWFNDPGVALVQTPQWFSNVTEADPLGSQAPLFYGPVQQGKDGWNAAFFCGSNALIRREALMQLGITGYVREVEEATRTALRTSVRILDRARRRAHRELADAAPVIERIRASAVSSLAALDAGEPVADVTYEFQQVLYRESRERVSQDLAGIQADLADLAELGLTAIDQDALTGQTIVDEEALDRLADRDLTPLAAIESVRELIDAVNVDRRDEAQPILPLATVSVTEDMATCMRLHATGWKSVYHHEILARGLAPEDLGTMLQQRLRWAQGTIQVLLKENPLTQRGLSWGQRLMYFATMWSYLSGFAALAFLLAPVFYLCFGALPVHAYGLTFLVMFVPYFVLNQLVFAVVGYGIQTWRGHQYSLAMFPVWIRACLTAAANVWFGRKLGFVVTDKEHKGGVRRRFPVRLIWPQLMMMVLLVAAVVVGAVRLWTGETVTVVGVAVNTIWVAYDLVVMSVIIQAALYVAPERPDNPAEELVP